MDYYSHALPWQYDPRLPREGAGSGRRSHRVQRLRELLFGRSATRRQKCLCECAGVARGRSDWPRYTLLLGTTYGKTYATEKSRCVWKATPSASRQLPREGAVYHKIHVVGIFSAADDYCPQALPRQYDPRLPREGAGSRRRRETEGVARGRTATRRRKCPCKCAGVARGRSATRGTVESIDLEKKSCPRPHRNETSKMSVRMRGSCPSAAAQSQ